MKRLFLASTALLALASTSFAADLPYRQAPPPMPAIPVFTWTGFYFGANAGYSFSDDNRITTIGVFQNNINNVNALARPPVVKIEREGFAAGAQLGYNQQFGMFVLGIEADIDYLDSDKTVTYASPTTFGAALAGTQSSFRQKLDYLGTVRGRVGLAFDRFLVYGTGGFAYGEEKLEANFLNSAGALQFTGNRVGDGLQTGYVAGGGVEYALPTAFSLFSSNAVTLKAEYLYYDLGRKHLSVPATGLGSGAYVSTFETTGSVVRAGINFKFGL